MIFFLSQGIDVKKQKKQKMVIVSLMKPCDEGGPMLFPIDLRMEQYQTFNGCKSCHTIFLMSNDWMSHDKGPTCVPSLAILGDMLVKAKVGCT